MILEGIFKGVKESGSYLLYPRFLQLFIENQLTNFRAHAATYDAPKLV
jgi:hypothetical protein